MKQEISRRGWSIPIETGGSTVRVRYYPLTHHLPDKAWIMKKAIRKGRPG
jgi:hypothetical protein